MQVLMYKICVDLEVHTLLCLWLGQFFCRDLRAFRVGLFRQGTIVKMLFWKSLWQVLEVSLLMAI
jgi:hypothetical protein